jgi:hypothetical protein
MSKAKPKKHTTKTRAKSKVSVKKMASSNNPCCPVIRVETRPVYSTSRKEIVGESIKVAVGKTTRRFKTAADADRYIEQAKTAQDAKRCRPVVDLVELSGRTTA